MGLEDKLEEQEEGEKLKLRVLKVLSKGPKTKQEITKKLGITGWQFRKMKEDLRANGLPLNYDRSLQAYKLGNVYQPNDTEQAIVDELRKLKLNKNDLESVLKGVRSINPKRYAPERLKFTDYKVRLGVFSDAHMGHECYRADVFNSFVDQCSKREPDFILNCGDTIEGMSRRQGHIYQLLKIGYTQQVDCFTEQFQKLADIGYKAHSIEAQDSHSGWFRNKADMGVDIGKELDNKSKGYKFIGYDEQDLVLDNGLRIRLRHPGGGTAYAMSYKMQKYISSISGGQKPNVLFQGHFHKALYMRYRNIHGFEVGCLQDQTLFMKKKNTPSHVGYWFVDVYYSKDRGVERVLNEFVPFYE